MFFISRIDQSVYKSFLMHLFWIGLILLIWVLLFPAEGYKTDRWVDLGFISFQPSEILRLLLPLAAASYLTRSQRRPSVKDWCIVLSAILVSSFLIYLQPDLGTSLIVLASGCIPVFLAGFSLLAIFILIALILISSPFLWANLTPYMQQRVITLFNPESDLLGAGWNISQSKTAIGSGGFMGKGYLSGTQSQLDFIPESHSDFIFSVIGEEFGFLGIILLFLVYGIILYRVFKIAFNSSTEFSRLTVSTIGFIFLIYILINVSMTVGTLPVVGLPLPLISQGGTSILIHLVAFGFVLSMKKRETW
jgi:rod shape determining protein RodA